MKIIVATDGSEYSHKAIEKVGDFFSNMVNLEIKILTTYERILPIDAFALSAQYSNEMELFSKENAEKTVSSAAEKISQKLPDATVTTMVEVGFPERTLVKLATEWQADLIVVGSHGRGFWDRLTLGSVSDAVVHHAPCSVLIVRE